MHTNHRRKRSKHNPRKGQGWSNRNPSSFAPEKRIASRKYRYQVREEMAHGRWDDIPAVIRRTILWDYW